METNYIIFFQFKYKYPLCPYETDEEQYITRNKPYRASLGQETKKRKIFIIIVFLFNT